MISDEMCVMGLMLADTGSHRFLMCCVMKAFSPVFTLEKLELSC